MATAPQVRKRSRSTAGFAKTEDVTQVEGSAPHIPVDAVEAVIERYSGRPIPLDVLYPDPPKPRSALDHNPAPRRNLVPTPANGAVQRNIATEQAYIRESQLKLVHRFVMRGASMQQVATALGVSIHEAYQLRIELFRRVGEEASSIDFPTFVGMSMGFYNEIKSSALRGFDAEGVTHKEKQTYLMVAKAAEDSQHRLLQVAGFYDDVKLRPKQESGDTQADDMADMQNAMRMMLDPAAYVREIEAVLSDDSGVYEPSMDEPEARIRVL